MASSLTERIFRHLQSHPWRVAALTMLAAGLAFLGLFRIPFEGSLETMLPENSEALRTVTFLHNSNLSDRVAVSVEMDPEGAERPLTDEMNRLAERLEQLPPVKDIETFPSGGTMMQEMLFFVERTGELLNEEQINRLEKRLSRDDIRAVLEKWYGRLARPEGGFMVELLRRDPLDLSSFILGRVDRLIRSFGYSGKVEKGHLVHPNGRHGLLLLSTDISVTDTVGARRLVELVNEELENTSDGFSAELIAAHTHSVSNENILRGDIRLTVTLASVGFIILFLGIFQDLRAILLFLLPGISVLFALNFAALILGRLSYLVIGFGAVLAGIAVDYGIHVYMSMRHETEPWPAVRRIIRPVCVGALTTLSVFVAFVISRIPGYRQLGVFAVLSITLSVGAALFILPVFFRTGQSEPDEDANPGLVPRRFNILIGLFFVLSIPVCAVLARGLEVETTLTRLDGTPEQILRREKRFQKLWTGTEEGQAVAVVEGDTYREAEQMNQRLYNALTEKLDKDQFSNLATLWPAQSVRRNNLDRWRELWTEQRIENVRDRLSSEGREFGFKPEAFDRFFQQLSTQELTDHRPTDNALFSRFEERFVKKHGDVYMFLTFLPDRPELRQTVRGVLDDLPGGFLASPAALGETLSRSVASEVRTVSIIALAFIIIVIILLVRNLRRSLAALLPAVTGVLWLLAIMTLAGLPLDIANMIAGIVVVGLCIDYGIFMVHGCASAPRALVSIRRAITLSTATTLMGAGVLVFASHPALFSIGITLVVGVTAGFLTAILAVPGICALTGINSS
ncbi:MAG: MMPL family transporter [Planctomycetota bacterium]